MPINTSAWFAADQSHQTLLGATRARLLVLISLLTCAIAAVWLLLTAGTLGQARPLFVAFCALTPAPFLTIAYLAWRRGPNLDLLAHAFLMSFYLVVSFVAASLGGAVSPTAFFLMLIPALATLLLGIRAGSVWLGVVAATYLVLHLARASLPLPSYIAPSSGADYVIAAEEVSYWNALILSLLALAASASVVIFHVAIRRSSAQLVAAALDARAAAEARAIAEEVSRSKSEFIRNMSHELRTPLNAIIGYSELLIEGAEDDQRDTDAGDSKRVLDAATRLLAMVNDVLRLANSDAESGKANLDECDVEALLRDAAAAASPAIAANGNTLAIDADLAPGLWLCDGPKLSHCLNNLLSNAAKFTEGGEVVLRARQRREGEQAWLTLSVVDSGIGIAEAKIGTLFEPFGLGDASMARIHEGAGLGLAVTRQLARLMSGEVSASSKAGSGSCFEITIPAVFLPDVPAHLLRSA